MAFTAGAQNKTFDIDQVRAAFGAAAAEHFQILGDELAGLESEKRPGAYWLVRVKPKRSGHYAVRFTFKYNHPSYDEGENVLYVRVGGKICDRQAQPQAGIARFCLGDTVILPIRAANRYAYSFQIKYTYEEPEDFRGKKAKAPADQDAAEVQNPVGPYLRYLGSKRAQMDQRGVGPSTVIYSAVFEAVRPGKFNIGLRPDTGSRVVEAPGISHGWGTPVVILDPGTPITYLAGKEDTIDYSDNRRFSSHGGGTFPTNILLLQPGDIIELPFLTTVEEEHGVMKDVRDPRGAYRPSIHKAAFRVDSYLSYNAFVADYFPAGQPEVPAK